MVGKVEIIVAGEGQQAAAVAFNPWAFPAKTLGKRAPQSGAIELLQFANSEIIQGPHRPFASRERGVSGGASGGGFARRMISISPGKESGSGHGREFRHGPSVAPTIMLGC